MKEFVKNFPYFKLLSFSLSSVALIYLAQMGVGYLYLFSDIILVLVLSWLISFIMESPVEWLSKKRMSRVKSAILIYSIITIVFSLLVIKALPILIYQINSLTNILPYYLNYFPNWANKAGDFILATLNNSLLIIQQIASTVFYLIFILVLSFYFVVDRAKIKKNILKIVPKQYRDEVEYLHEAINLSFSGFIKAQVIFGVVYGIFLAIFLLFFSPQYALLASLLSGVLMTLPFIGPFLALVPPILVLLPYGLTYTFWLTLIIFIFQQILINIFGPKIYSQNIKLHPIWILLSFLIGLKLAGVWGSIFAVPVASFLAIIISAFGKRLKDRIVQE